MNGGNGQEQTGSERLDRIERALELLVNDHVLFREEHKQLLTAQVLLTGSLHQLTERLDKLTERVDNMAVKVDKLSDDVGLMRENFDARLKRLVLLCYTMWGGQSWLQLPFRRLTMLILLRTSFSKRYFLLNAAPPKATSALGYCR
jgi:hypothetical protein